MNQNLDVVSIYVPYRPLREKRQWIDVFEKGTMQVYGFIAQEVKEMLDYVSSPITETVPNVYELVTFSGDILTIMFNTVDLSRAPSGALFPKLKLKTIDGKDEFVNILFFAHTQG